MPYCDSVGQRLVQPARIARRILRDPANRLVDGRVQIVRRLDSSLPKTMADYHRLQQVFVNIINNAYQAINTIGSGTLTVETG